MTLEGEGETLDQLDHAEIAECALAYRDGSRFGFGRFNGLRGRLFAAQERQRLRERRVLVRGGFRGWIIERARGRRAEDRRSEILRRGLERRFGGDARL